MGVDDGDHDERAEVIDDRERQQEHTQPRGGARREQREGAERQGGVGGHRGAPAARTRATGVERQVDRDGHRHAANRRKHRDRQTAPLAQLAQIELALCLEANDEEEERHQPFVDPVAQAG